ncbi:hypothetical protein [Ferruginibacter albus]|uniref:hypothetical protein n=1 Tax=Ferruginibacter albus TaxID=2875540 RepID=UPI001CC516AE|nr:hypothetical protein [Ferruginibacter albus]UAY51364.1 hypothetical protein K9M53_12295 [Ferruginibacter albus]
MKSKKYQGFTCFDFYLSKLEVLLNKATSQKNPALWLYRNNARTPLFMLEALSRAYAAMYPEFKFSKLDARFKVLEDALGAIDYYDAFAKEFAINKAIPAPVLTYLQAMTREKTQNFNEILKEKSWITDKDPKIEKIRSKMSEIKWRKEAADIKAIKEYYDLSIKEIIKFTRRSDFHFENVEADVHELRRKLRWLSIYPQAFCGSIQLSKVPKVPAHLKKYLTKEIVSSPFNKLPDAGDKKHFLILEQNHFYALSWMIAELGKLKDEGLRVIVIKEALQQNTSLSDADAFKQAYKITGTKQLTIKKILDRSDDICKKYFAEKNLQHLVIGCGKIDK